MRTQTSAPVTALPRWAIIAIVGMLGVVVGFGVRVYAQTATEFRDPTCNPNDAAGPSGCNTSSPLFLAPSNKSTAQLVQTPIQVGQSTSNSDKKSIQIFGDVVLGSWTAGAIPNTYTLQRAAQAGQAINVSSTDDFALVANTSTGTAALQANATSGTGDAIQATSFGGRGIYATGAPAGQFEGDVEIISGGDLSVAGNVNIVGTLMVDNELVGSVAKSVRDNGSAYLGGSGVTDMTFDVSNVNPSVEVDLRTAGYLNDTNFQVLSVDAMYDADATAGAVSWRPAVNATNFFEYRECAAGVFNGKIFLQSDVAGGTKFRVHIRYRADVDAICGAPQFTLAVNSGASSGNAFNQPFVFNTNPGSIPVTGAATYAWDFGEDANNDIDCQTTSPTAACPGTGNGTGFTFSGNVLTPTVTYPAAVTTGAKTATLTITDQAGASPRSININIFRAAFTVAQRAELTQYVNITDGTNYGGMTDVQCRIDLQTNGTNDITPAAGTNCTNTTNTVAHTYNTTYTETMTLLHSSCPSGVCHSTTRTITTRNSCTQGGPCGVGRTCCASNWSCTVGGKTTDYGSGCFTPSAGCSCGAVGGDVGT